MVAERKTNIEKELMIVERKTNVGKELMVVEPVEG